jgi:tetratricopeptide (TPR) repeat protein
MIPCNCFLNSVLRGRIGRVVTAGLLTAALLPAALGARAGGAPSGPSGSIEAAEAQARARPDDGAAQKTLGYAYYEAGRLEEAQAAFERAATIDPDDLGARVNLAIVLCDLGRHEQGRQIFDRVIEANLEDASLRVHRAKCAYAMGAIGLAVEDLVRALEIDPAHQLAHFELGVAFADAGIYAEAIREWGAVLSANPETPIAVQARENIRVLRGVQDEEESHDASRR